MKKVAKAERIAIKKKYGSNHIGKKLKDDEIAKKKINSKNYLKQNKQQ